MTDHDGLYSDRCDNIVRQCVCVTQRHPCGAAEVDARTLVSHNKRQTDVLVSQLTQASDFPCH